MEELQSTEILDREILEDARRKAQTILKNGDKTAQAKSAEWEKKTASVIDELRAKYEKQRGLLFQEIMARLPLDKHHARAEKIESLLNQAVEKWYAGLEREKVLGILKADLERRLTYCGEFKDEQPRALIRKLEKDEAAAILKELLPGQQCAIERADAIGSEDASPPYPEIILENDSARITASVYQTVDFLLHEKRAELVEALIGADALSSKAALAENAPGGAA